MMLWEWIKHHPNSTAWVVVGVLMTLLLLAVFGPVVHL
jgi:hypothetical protein